MSRIFNERLEAMSVSIKRIEKELERITVILRTSQFKEELMKRVWDPETKLGEDLLKIEFENSEKD